MNDEVARKVESFFAAYPVKSFAKGQIITHADEKPHGVLYMLTGRVNQYDITSNGVEVVVNIFKPPAFFPMSWAINKTPNQFFFEAAIPTTAHEAPAEDVVAFLRSNPEVALDLLARVYRGVDGVLRRTTHLMAGDARSRLTFELLNAANRFGNTDKEGRVTIPLTESDLAKHSGLARETVSRAFQKLKNAGLVQLDHGTIVVPSIKVLDAALDKDF